MKLLLTLVALLSLSGGSYAQTSRPASAAPLLFERAQRSRPVPAAGPGTQARGISASVVVPGRSVEHRWMLPTGRWGDGTITSHTYNSRGQVTQHLINDSVSNQPRRRELLTYNAQGAVTERLDQRWNGTAYVNEIREVHTFDAQSRALISLYQTWQNNTWFTSNGSRSAYTTNPAGIVVGETFENWDAMAGTWQPSGRLTYLLNASNQWTDVVQEGWTNGAYVNIARIRNISWHNWAELQPAYFEQQEWDDFANAWFDAQRFTFTYQSNGSTVYIGEAFVAPGVWVNDMRYTDTYDNFGNILLEQGEEWDNAAWNIVYGYQYLLSYTATNQVRRKVVQQFNDRAGAYVNSLVTAYSGFITLETRRATELEAAASLYPNPTQATATLLVAGLRDQGTVPGQVLNAMGQVVQPLSLRPQQGTIRQELDLSALPAGLYTVRLHTTAGTVVKRVVRQ
ncbi:T9SS type A sorting domain-containing protein [Hymenobacter sp. BT175]|uniref:T9SS type A sorting domain-containing protein n=1 Tax=Hymenobacter translucens TaxID=2886507 RepID=UPI001D0E6D79|nr:T9SS type A sorting domain-containing protein [Hymenobacter translucens]MCC2547886.1 T9SS type A sorting domain-containing protein [Hymenobacter translucens]